MRFGYPSFLQETWARQVFALTSIMVVTVDASKYRAIGMAHQASSNIVVDIEGALTLLMRFEVMAVPSRLWLRSQPRQGMIGMSVGDMIAEGGNSPTRRSDARLRRLAS